jgi:spermidine synthase
MKGRKMTEWVEEKLHATWRARLVVENVVFEEKTEHQHLLIFDNPAFGRVLMLDDIIQLSSSDEFIYHEMMTHVPLFALEEPKKVLIIGGGDGGVLREALRHPSVEKVTMCEIDRSVIDLCTKFFPGISAGAFDNPRADIVIGDGAKFVEETDERYDAVLVDSTDPIGPGAVLFTPEFYAGCKRCMKPGGALITQQGLVFFQPDESAKSVRTFRGMFNDASIYLPVTASYLGGHFALGWATDDAALRQVSVETLRQRFDRAALETRYYSPELHKAAFVLPMYVSRKLEEKN